MRTEHAAVFDVRLHEVLSAYGRDAPSEFALRAWWAALEPFDWPQIEQALAQHLAECKFPPTPADIVLRLVATDGRPAAEEAWAIASSALDEHDTVVWSDEIAEAWAIARPVYAIGDKVGARQAFNAAYERAVTAARRRLQPARWTVSLGRDPQRRIDALRDAERRGRLSGHMLARLLPPETQGAARQLAGPVPVAGVLDDNVAAFPETGERERRRFLIAVREGIGRGERAKAEERAERSCRRREALAAQARRRAEVRVQLGERDDPKGNDGA